MTVSGLVLGFHIDAAVASAWRLIYDDPTAEWKEGHWSFSVCESCKLELHLSFLSVGCGFGLGLIMRYRPRGMGDF